MTNKQLSDAMREMGRKGGKARVKNQTKEQRSESARKAAKARWAKPLSLEPPVPIPAKPDTRPL
jgi:hypothetical protein